MIREAPSGRTVPLVATHWRPPADRSRLRWAYRQVGPRHDRVDLTDAELRALCELERSLPGSRADRPPSARRRVRARLRGAVLALAPLVRLVSWLLPVGLAVMVAFVAVSVVVSFVGAVLTACGMAAVLHRVSRRLRARAARRRSLAP
jgi:hypothetical protein